MKKKKIVGEKVQKGYKHQHKKTIKEKNTGDEKNIFSVSFVFDDQTTTIKSKTILEALEKFKQELIKSKCVLVVKKGKNKFEQIWYPARLRKLTMNSILREITEKRILMALQ